MDSELMAGALGAWGMLLLIAAILLFFLPFYVAGIYNHAKRAANEAKRGADSAAIAANEAVKQTSIQQTQLDLLLKTSAKKSTKKISKMGNASPYR